MDDLKKIINVAQIRAAEQNYLQENSTPSLELMENAALAFVHAIATKELTTKKIWVLCGTGNNGGDGFAVCRLLRDRGIAADALLIQFSETLSADCLANKNRLQQVTVLDSSAPPPDFSSVDLIIDAIFGSGLNKPVTGFTAHIIEAINKAGTTVYSIDVPSGLLCEGISESECIVKSDLVISFQRPKLSFFFPENGAYVKQWKFADIGLSEAFIHEQETAYFLLDEQVSKQVKSRPRQSHKGTYGHALIMAGSYGKMGAAILSAQACLRSGVGLLTSYVPECGYDIMQISVPEAMCLTDEDLKSLSSIPDLKPYDAIGVGPGISCGDLTVKMLHKLLENCVQPLVLDADAINILSANNELIEMLPENTILTPHIKEFDRLVGSSSNTIERLNKQIAFSKKHNCIIVLKNAYTSVSSPQGAVFFNTSGNQGMATGGSGDVLTGIITGLLAQHYESLTAALIGVYFHGKAGDQAVKQRSFSSLIASDIIEQLNIEA